MKIGVKVVDFHQLLFFPFLRERERAQREADLLRAHQVRSAAISGALCTTFLLQTWTLGLKIHNGNKVGDSGNTG